MDHRTPRRRFARAAILRAGRLLRLPVRTLVWLARAVRRYFWLLVLAGAVGAFVVVVLIPQVTTDGDEDDAPPQEPVAATRQDLRVTVPAVGTIDYGSIIELGFAEAGVIAGIAVAEGDVVAAGGTLATLEAADLERDVDDAEAALRRAQLDLAELLADPDPMDLRRAELDLSEARAALADLDNPPDAASVAAAEASVASAAGAACRRAGHARQAAGRADRTRDCRRREQSRLRPLVAGDRPGRPDRPGGGSRRPGCAGGA